MLSLTFFNRAHKTYKLTGHPGYYPKFGFKQAGIWGIKDPFGAPYPIEAFVALELEKGALKGADGVVEYPEEFNDLKE